jgi:hypothetical protein
MGSAMPKYRILWLTLFALAMGVLEAIVVVYLRLLYYPDGFQFPIMPMEERVALIEIAREAATLVMLFTLSVLAGRDRLDRFFLFALLFGIWDIFYYLSLWIMLDWPASLFTWDILFLIPIPWLAPVIYPVIISILLITGYTVHQILVRMGRALSPSLTEWLIASTGGLVVIVSFCWNWRVVINGSTPTSFPAFIYFSGVVLGTLPFVNASLRATKETLQA